MPTFLKRAEKEMRHLQNQMQLAANQSPTFTQQVENDWDEFQDEIRMSAKHLNQHLGDLLTKITNNPEFIMDELRKGWKKFVEQAEEFKKEASEFTKKNLPKDISDLCEKAFNFLSQIIQSLNSLFGPKHAQAESQKKDGVSRKHARDEYHEQDRPHAPQIKKPRKN